ncbi:MAG: hypothetical protein OXG98_08590 [Gemmatimonadetes bacterium]|nr:hypothetical protein [Gemmatimonadota bacterium]
MHDALTLENHGLPSALLCTSSFAHTARVMAEQLGQGDYPIIEIEHPIGRLDGDGITERVEQALGRAADLLL